MLIPVEHLQTEVYWLMNGISGGRKMNPRRSVLEKRRAPAMGRAAIGQKSTA